MDPYCPTHGWLTHAFIHESAHAVAAFDHSIPIESVKISAPAEWEEAFSAHSPGGNVPVEPAEVWTRRDPRAALVFALAGSLAEDSMLGHMLNRGWEGDQAVWRIGMGLTSDNTPGSITEALGAPLSEVVSETRAWVKNAQPRIIAVAEALLAKPITPGVPMVVDYSDGPWILTGAQLHSVLS